jgi:hypothetical protein
VIIPLFHNQTMRYVDAKVDTNVKTTIIDTSFFNIIVSLKMVAFVVVIVW